MESTYRHRNVYRAIEANSKFGQVTRARLEEARLDPQSRQGMLGGQKLGATLLLQFFFL